MGRVIVSPSTVGAGGPARPLTVPRWRSHQATTPTTRMDATAPRASGWRLRAGASCRGPGRNDATICRTCASSLQRDADLVQEQQGPLRDVASPRFEPGAELE